jgi:hypothetical protein
MNLLRLCKALGGELDAHPNGERVPDRDFQIRARKQGLLLPTPTTLKTTFLSAYRSTRQSPIGARRHKRRARA